MIIGHKKQLKFLKASKEKDRISHAYLFSGQEKLGKRTVALEWISMLFGQEIKGHPDLTLIEPAGKEIQIGQIKTLIKNLSLKAYSAPLKAAVIDSAHLMNREAQSSLLKTLEEPKGNTLLILVSSEPDRLLGTITSRVQTVKFYPVEKKEITDYLKEKGVSMAESDNLYKFSLGSPGLIMDFLAGGKEFGTVDKEVKNLEKIIGSDLSFRFQYAKDLADNPEELKQTLDAWLAFLREDMLSRVFSEKEGALRLSRVISKLQEIRRLIFNTNINTRLALENLMIEL